MDIIEILLVVVVCCFWGMFILWWITHLRYKSMLMDYMNLLDKHLEAIVEKLSKKGQ